MKTKNLKSGHSSNVQKAINPEEKDYIEENIWYFIDSEAKYTRTVAGNKFYIEPDKKAKLRILLLDYILEHFTLHELFNVFFCRGGYSLDATNISESRREAIDFINEDESLTEEEAKRLKRKIWDINPILFGLILELIHESELFWDDKKQEVVYPEFDEDGHAD